MEVYLITIVLVIIFANLANYLGKINTIKNNRYLVKNRFFVFLTTIILVLVGGLRWRVGTDYWQYSVNYNNYISTVWNDLLNYNDPGIKLISWVASLIYDDYATMFFLASLITIGLFVSTISKFSKTFVFSILLFMFIGSWHGSFNGVKQYLACAILFAGHRYIFKRNFLKYFFIVFLASLFHISSWGMLLLYFVPRKRLNIRHLIMMVIISFAIILSYDYLFQLAENIRGDSFAITDYTLREVNIFRVLVAFAPLIVYFTLTNKQRLSSEDYFYINLLFINAAVASATSQSAYLARFLIYTNVFTIIGLPRLLNFKDKNLRFLIQMLIIILYVVFWYIDITKSSNLVNFQWILDRNV